MFLQSNSNKSIQIQDPQAESNLNNNLNPFFISQPFTDYNNDNRQYDITSSTSQRSMNPSLLISADCSQQYDPHPYPHIPQPPIFQSRPSTGDNTNNQQYDTTPRRPRRQNSLAKPFTNKNNTDQQYDMIPHPWQNSYSQTHPFGNDNNDVQQHNIPPRRWQSSYSQTQSFGNDNNDAQQHNIPPRRWQSSYSQTQSFGNDDNNNDQQYNSTSRRQ